jgi:hypothetical protein
VIRFEAVKGRELSAVETFFAIKMFSLPPTQGLPKNSE